VSTNPYKPSSDILHLDEKSIRTKPPFLRTMVALIILNTCLAIGLSYHWNALSKLSDRNGGILILISVFSHCLTLLGAYQLHRCSKYAYIPILIHSVYALIIYALSLPTMIMLCTAIEGYRDQIGSSTRVDQALLYLVVNAYGFVMTLLYPSYCIYWRKKGLLK